MLPRVRQEIDEVKAAFPALRETVLQDGTIHLEIPDAPVPARWTPSHIALLLVVAPAYPTQRPTMFTDPKIKLIEPSKHPDGSSEQDVAGKKWRSYCWSPTSWELSRETLLRFTKFALSRFEEYR